MFGSCQNLKLIRFLVSTPRLPEHCTCPAPETLPHRSLQHLHAAQGRTPYLTAHYIICMQYKAVPCPVGKRGIEVQFLDYSKPVPASSKICNNQFGEPCGGSAIAFPVRIRRVPSWHIGNQLISVTMGLGQS